LLTLPRFIYVTLLLDLFDVTFVVGF
jgi:hypothetical protein